MSISHRYLIWFRTIFSYHFTIYFISALKKMDFIYPHDLLIVNKTDTDRWITLNAGNNFQIFRPNQETSRSSYSQMIVTFFQGNFTASSWVAAGYFGIFNIKLTGLLWIKNTIWISHHGLVLQNIHNGLSCWELEIVLSSAFCLHVIK